MTVPYFWEHIFGIMYTLIDIIVKPYYKYAFAFVIQFTVFKHRHMICMSIWTNIDGCVCL